MSNRAKWSEFEEIFNQTDAVEILKKNYISDYLRKFQNKYGKNLIHMSVEFNKPDIAQYLLQIKCKKNQINRQDGLSPLALALTLPHEDSHKLVNVLCQAKVSYSWSNIAGPSKTLEFKNETAASVLRTSVKTHLLCLMNKCSLQDDVNSIKMVKSLHKLHWPQESLSFLNLHLAGISFAQLYYSVADGDAEKVKHTLDNNRYGPRALVISLRKAVDTIHPKSLVIMKLLLDKGMQLWKLNNKGFALLETAFYQNDVDKALLLINNGVDYEVRVDYFIQELCMNKVVHDNDNFCLNVFVKPAIAFDYFLECSLTGQFCRDCLDSLVKYHLRIDGYDFPQEFVENLGISMRIIEYRKELEKMKRVEVYEDLTVLDIIDKPLDNIVAYTKNKELMDKLEAVTFEKSFPSFSDTIIKKLELAKRIRLWTDQSKDFLAECLAVFVGSNDVILSKIVRYLGVPNLIVLSLK